MSSSARLWKSFSYYRTSIVLLTAEMTLPTLCHFSYDVNVFDEQIVSSITNFLDELAAMHTSSKPAKIENFDKLKQRPQYFKLSSCLTYNSADKNMHML